MWWTWYVKVYRLQRVKAIEPAQKHQLIHRRQHVTQWLERQQIEKRRKEQLRQRKKGAKKKPLGDGIQVDTKISKSDAFSKCGLKPKTVQQQADTAANSKTRKRNTNESEPQRQNPAFATDRSNVSEDLATIKLNLIAKEKLSKTWFWSKSSRRRGQRKQWQFNQ